MEVMINLNHPVGSGEAGTIRKEEYNNLLLSTLFLHTVIKSSDVFPKFDNMQS
jgi:hypothetical protein